MIFSFDERKAYQNTKRAYEDVKEAIKRNFNRLWRDKLEALLASTNEAFGGPIVALALTYDRSNDGKKSTLDQSRVIQRLENIHSLDKPIVGTIRDTFRLKIRVPVSGEGRPSYATTVKSIGGPDDNTGLSKSLPMSEELASSILGSHSIFP